jgi:8-oxo-dGTP pyrophosphatase MutT (NUDIX family)
MPEPALIERLRRAAYPLDAVPTGEPWNRAELDGLLTSGEPRQAAVLLGVVERRSAPTVLMTRRHDGLRHHAGQVSLPGGRIEPDDCNPAAAALREASEEVGLVPAQARLLGYLDPLLTITGFRVLPVLALIDADFEPVPDPREVAEVFEVPLDLLLDPQRLERIELQFGGRPRSVLQYRYAPQRIWGVTASILYNLRQRLARASIMQG